MDFYIGTTFSGNYKTLQIKEGNVNIQFDMLNSRECKEMALEFISAAYQLVDTDQEMVELFEQVTGLVDEEDE